jgi:hypothetical protein
MLSVPMSCREREQGPGRGASRRRTRPGSPSAVPDKHGPFGPGFVQDGTQVIRPHVEARRSKDPVGEARAAFVKQDDPRERRESLEKSNTPGGLELDLEVSSHSEGVDEIDRSTATHLEGDVHAIDRPRVAHLGLFHVRSNPSRPHHADANRLPSDLPRAAICCRSLCEFRFRIPRVDLPAPKGQGALATIVQVEEPPPTPSGVSNSASASRSSGSSCGRGL